MESLKEKYIKMSNIPPKYIKEYTDILVPQENQLSGYETLKWFSDNLVNNIKEGNNLFIRGSVGSGKTSNATKLGLKYIYEYACNYSYKNNCPVLYVNVTDWLLRKKKSISNDSEDIDLLESNMRSTKLLILDDIGYSPSSNFDLTQLYSIIDYRTSYLKSTIFIGKFFGDDSVDKLIDSCGPSIARRILQNSFEVSL